MNYTGFLVTWLTIWTLIIVALPPAENPTEEYPHNSYYKTCRCNWSVINDGVASIVVISDEHGNNISVDIKDGRMFNIYPSN